MKQSRVAAQMAHIAEKLGEETEDAELSIYQPDRNLRERQVHEAYLRLAECQRIERKNRVHLFAMSAQVMRRVLVDFARSQQRRKRGEVISLCH